MSGFTNNKPKQQPDHQPKIKNLEEILCPVVPYSALTEDVLKASQIQCRPICVSDGAGNNYVMASAKTCNFLCMHCNDAAKLFKLEEPGKGERPGGCQLSSLDNHFRPPNCGMSRKDHKDDSTWLNCIRCYSIPLQTEADKKKKDALKIMSSVKTATVAQLKKPEYFDGHKGKHALVPQKAWDFVMNNLGVADMIAAAEAEADKKKAAAQAEADKKKAAKAKAKRKADEEVSEDEEDGSSVDDTLVQAAARRPTSKRLRKKADNTI